VSKLADIEAAVSKTVGEFGRIDGLVNNAGVNFVKDSLQVTPKIGTAS